MWNVSHKGVIMKKVFRLKNLGCAHCAAKMEKSINKLKGVNGATISFMTARFTLDADDSSFDDILAECKKIIRKIEKDCEIIE